MRELTKKDYAEEDDFYVYHSHSAIFVPNLECMFIQSQDGKMDWHCFRLDNMDLDGKYEEGEIDNEIKRFLDQGFTVYALSSEDSISEVASIQELYT